MHRININQTNHEIANHIHPPYMMPSICLIICSMAVALPVYNCWQWHMFPFILGLQTEQIKCPLLQLNICKGGLMSSMQMGHSGIREAGIGARWAP